MVSCHCIQVFWVLISGLTLRVDLLLLPMGFGVGTQVLRNTKPSLPSNCQIVLVEICNEAG